jgi:hypothetical protein
LIEDNSTVLQILKNTKNAASVEELTSIILDGLKSEVISKSEETLLNLIFSETTSQENLDNFLKQWDIEVVGGHKALLLSYFMKMHPELKFSDYVAPRLKGLLQFFRFKNMKLISHYTKICNELKKSDIEFLIFKGGCIKHLRPEYPRIMGDIDILVHEKDYIKAGKIVEQLGYDTAWDIHSIDIHPKDSEEGIMDIHKYIIMQSDKEKAFIPDLFKRATKQNVFGIPALVPCNEDLLFITLVNLVRNLRNKTSYSGIPYTLFDCKFLIDSKPDFDWNIVIQNSKKTKTENHVYFAIQFINGIVPNLLPEKIKYDTFFEKEFEKYCILLTYQRFYLWEMKQKSHQMKIKDIFSSFEFFREYLKLKPKYFILKLGIIRKNPVFAKIILRRAGLFA